MHATEVSANDFFWLIGSLCQINRIPFDAQLILQRFLAPPSRRMSQPMLRLATLAKLLLGYYQATDGRMTIDGRDIRQLSANDLRQYFGIVPQETYLYSGTIYDNLVAAQPLATFDEVIKDCRVAEIHYTIEKVPKGYNTEIGEHGVGLSRV